jgi:eukaryotic-like serine/threonine-protein kinase
MAALVVLVGLAACGDSSKPAGPAAVSLPLTPAQLAPPDGAVFDHYPRDMTVSWAPVAGAASYWVEVEYCQPPRCVDGVTAPWYRENLTATSFSFSFVGGQPGRWRVWAVGPTSLESPKSTWWQFYFTR